MELAILFFLFLCFLIVILLYVNGNQSNEILELSVKLDKKQVTINLLKEDNHKKKKEINELSQECKQANSRKEKYLREKNFLKSQNEELNKKLSNTKVSLDKTNVLKIKRKENE